MHGMAQRLSQLAGSRVRSLSAGEFEAYDGRVLAAAEAHGKHLLVHFEGVPGAAHIHCGMSGRVSTRQHRRALGDDGFPRTEPARGATVRWRLLTDTFVADVIAPLVCEVLDEDGVAALHARLGPDPLRDDANAGEFFSRVLRSRRAIGMLLLDQSVLAGVGNVYRAEVLHRQRLSPFTLGRDLDEDRVELLWRDVVDLMRVGVGAGWIVTAPGQVRVAKDLLVRGETVPRWRKVYAVYARGGKPCRVCGTTIRSQAMGRQRIFWCPVCQPEAAAAPPG